MSLPEDAYDLFVVGGGINGLGVARDAAGRGLKVALCEKDDLGAHTSSASTKLIHGGLRYLEHYDFALVRKALIEREVLLSAAPHIIWPLRFVLPLGRTDRPSWLIRLGLFLYDHLGGRKILPPTSAVHRHTSDTLNSLKAEFVKAFEYSDCWVDDSRLCVLNAMDARTHGADVFVRERCIDLSRGQDAWTITLEKRDGDQRTLTARAVVNAAGPWVDQVLPRNGANDTATSVRLVKGSHIVTVRLYDGDHCFFFQNPDGRIFFAIPYLAGTATLIGTTDIPYDSSDIDGVAISDAEIDYICESASAYFAQPITRSDVRSTYAGVRPLYDDHSADASKVTRDYVLKHDGDGGAPIVSIFGGKITTYRTLAESVMRLLSGTFPTMGDPWTKHAPLPGGDIDDANFKRFVEELAATYPWLDASLRWRLARAYGTCVHAILAGATSPRDLGEHFGAGLYEAEVRYLTDVEFAQTADDILMRRSKLGLTMSASEQEALASWLDAQAAAPQGASEPKALAR